MQLQTIFKFTVEPLVLLQHHPLERPAGAGASLPNHLFEAWFATYKAHALNTVEYDVIGSGGGIRKIMNKQVEFAATDTPMSDSEMASQRNKILHIPVSVGAVAVAFNIPNIDSQICQAPRYPEYLEGRLPIGITQK